jgi:hypothetical protein
MFVFLFRFLFPTFLDCDDIAERIMMICIKGKTGIHYLEMLDLKRYPFLANTGPAKACI